eukprot:scaffold1461_cov253-Pinguiococcus_pyrenoidosus.AAC.2
MFLTTSPSVLRFRAPSRQACQFQRGWQLLRLSDKIAIFQAAPLAGGSAGRQVSRIQVRPNFAKQASEQGPQVVVVTKLCQKRDVRADEASVRRKLGVQAEAELEHPESNVWTLVDAALDVRMCEIHPVP